MSDFEVAAIQYASKEMLATKMPEILTILTRRCFTEMSKHQGLPVPSTPPYIEVIPDDGPFSSGAEYVVRMTMHCRRVVVAPPSPQPWWSDEAKTMALNGSFPLKWVTGVVTS